MKIANRETVGGIIALVVAGILLAGCPTKGPAEKAGEKIDEAADEVGDAFD